MSETSEFGREVEEDHDLLTYNESGARLREEIAKLKTELGELRTQSAADSNQTIGAAAQRLAVLEESAERNACLAEGDKDAAGFLGYTPGKSTTD